MLHLPSYWLKKTLISVTAYTPNPYQIVLDFTKDSTLLIYTCTSKEGFFISIAGREAIRWGNIGSSL